MTLPTAYIDTALSSPPPGVLPPAYGSTDAGGELLPAYGDSAALALNFSGNYAFDPRITYTGASARMYYDSAGTLKYAPMNLLTYSQDFSNAAWTKSNSSVSADSGAAPDGTLTADKVVEDVATSTHGCNQSITPVVGTSYTLSVWAKAAERTIVRVATGSSLGTKVAFIDLADGVITSESGTGTASVVDSGNGWYRISLFVVATSAAADGLFVRLVSTGTTFSYAGDGTSGLFIWGAQINLGPEAFDYIPTTTAAVYLPRSNAYQDHDPSTLEPLGFLIEEARTNLLLQSQDLGTTWGLGSGGTLSVNSWTAPDGSLTGDTFTIAADATVPNQSVIVAASSTYTLSFFYNAAITNAAFFRIRFGVNGTSVSAWLDTSTRTFGTYNAQLSGGVVTSIGNNIYRVSLQIVYGASDAGSRSIGIAGVTANAGTTADTGKNLALWGMQFELGAFPTSYISTTTAAATRLADTALDDTISEWFNPLEGTLVVEYTNGRTTANGTAVVITDGTSSNSLRMVSSNGSAVGGYFNVVNGGVNQTNVIPASTAPVSGTTVKVAGSYKLDDFAASRDGGTTATDTSGTLPTVDRLEFGMLGGTSRLGGWLKSFTYYRKALPQSVQVLSS